jgi:hypothetical protein
VVSGGTWEGDTAVVEAVAMAAEEGEGEVSGTEDRHGRCHGLELNHGDR